MLEHLLVSVAMAVAFAAMAVHLATGGLPAMDVMSHLLWLWPLPWTLPLQAPVQGTLTYSAWLEARAGP